MRNSIPFILPGEQIGYFDLVGKDGETIDASALNDYRLSLIFIFKEPCSPCNENLLLWNKMARIVSTDGAGVFGIILQDHSSMKDFAEKSNLSFNVYVPQVPDRLKKELRLKTNYAQTILYHDRKVTINVQGKLDGNSYTGILKAAKKVLKKDK